jgi:hypothetical protein
LAKHHFVPEFYLKRWADKTSGKLLEFAWRPNGLHARETSPGVTGYEAGLYEVPGLPQRLSNFMEDRFFQGADSIAAEALAAFEQTGGVDIGNRLRSGWARFVRSMQLRSPERLKWLKQKCLDEMGPRLQALEADYDGIRRPDDPQTYVEAMRKYESGQHQERLWAMLLQKLVDSENVGSFVVNMRWNLLQLASDTREFLASDMPVVTSNGIIGDDASISLPIGPSTLFVAVNTAAAVERLPTIRVNHTFEFINDRVCRQANRFVFGRNHGMERFIENRMHAPRGWIDTKRKRNKLCRLKKGPQ